MDASQLGKGVIVNISNVITGLRVADVCKDGIFLMDKSLQVIRVGTFMLPFLILDNGRTDAKSFTTIEKGKDNMARLCQARLKAYFKDSKATLVDLRVVAEGVLTGDYIDVYKTKLYNKYSVEYAKSLEFFELIKQGKIRLNSRG